MTQLRWKPVLLALVLLSGSSAAGQHYTGPKSLGPFHIDRDVSLQSLFKRLRQPSAQGEVFCYRAQDGKVFLLLRGDHEGSREADYAVLSEAPICRNRSMRITSDDLRSWKTPEGIGLGSFESEVLKKYGKPSEVRDGNKYPDDDLPHIGKQLIYSAAPGDDNELVVADFGIHNGKVIWIILSNSE